MTHTVCLATPHTLAGTDNGAHLWIFINWALGLRAVGMRVVWLESTRGLTTRRPTADLHGALSDLRDRLRPLDLADTVVAAALNDDGSVVPPVGEPSAVDDVLDADLLINFLYAAPARFVKRFRRSALVDLDPGLLQIWMQRGQIEVAPHDAYFTIGETVGTAEARFPDCGLPWRHIPPPVFLPAWPVVPADASARYTTVTGWWDKWMELDGEVFSNEKRSAFLRYLPLPRLVPRELELSTILDEFTLSTDRVTLEEHGWKVRDARQVCATPGEVRRYLQSSWGEFTCARPSSARLSSTWVSDRTSCYLASGKPAIVEYTAPSLYPSEGGLIRFKTLGEAVSACETIEADYARHCHWARSIAETYFDARKVARQLLGETLA
jgi:hypothetical protein